MSRTETPQNDMHPIRIRRGRIPRNYFSYCEADSDHNNLNTYSCSADEVREETLSYINREINLANFGTTSDQNSSDVEHSRRESQAHLEDHEFDGNSSYQAENEPLLGNSYQLSPTREIRIETPELNSPFSTKSQSFIIDALKGTPAAFLALLLNLLDAMSYGIIIFPASDPHVPESARQAGISMFLVSSLISQLVFTFGGSGFKGAVGSFMVEVIPFLHIICNLIETFMSANASSHQITATIMAAYASSTILTGITFLLLGWFKLGNLIQFFPRHVLIGCIGGIGLFLIFTAVEVSSGVEPSSSLEYFYEIFEPAAFKLWGSSLISAIVLKIIQHFFSYPMVVPAFYSLLPIAFYIVTFSAGISLQELRKLGWLFDLPDASSAPFYTFWTYVDYSAVNWTAVATTLPTQFALVFFGILHVPINVPALSVSAKQDVDLSHEIIGHGIGNLLSGLFCVPQNYMVYSNSLLFLRSGGGSFASEIVLCVASVFLWIYGSLVARFVPVIVVGALIFHLGIDLLKESLYDSWHVGMHSLEYFTIWVIVAVMGLVGFTEGILIGILLTTIFFVVIYANKSVIKETFKGSQLRSTVHRVYRQQFFLDNVGDQIHIIKLQGFMFFGTVSQLSVGVEETLLEYPQTKFMVFDFTAVNGIDYSALESFSKIKRILAQNNVYLILCGISTVQDAFRRSGLISREDEFSSHQLRIFETLNEALEWCENRLLSVYFMKQRHLSIPNNHLGNIETVATPRNKQISAAASKIWDDHPHNEWHNVTGPLSLLATAFSDLHEVDFAMLSKVGNEFQCLEEKAGKVFYEMSQNSDCLFIVEKGQLGLKLGGRTSKVVETLLPGTMVGGLEMFGNQPRSCALIAISDCIVWKLSKKNFDLLSQSNPKMALDFITKIAIPFDNVRYYNSVHHLALLY